jgi:hypothetical protein
MKGIASKSINPSLLALTEPSRGKIGKGTRMAEREKNPYLKGNHVADFEGFFKKNVRI